MGQTTQAYEQLIERFVNWASTEPDIRTAIVIGSRARVDHPADEWADLDVIVVTRDPERLLLNTDWLAKMGVPVLTFVEPTASGNDKERRVLFEGGLDVDFAVLPHEKVQMVLQSEMNSQLAIELTTAFGRGMRVLLDKDSQIGALSNLLKAAVQSPPSRLPTQQDFLQVVHDFWYHAVWTAKHLRRGELWWAKSSCDWGLKHLLRQMMEWHAQAIKGADYDTWFRGRFLEQWADPRVLEQLRKAFARYDEDDIWRALLVTMDMFRWLSVETAERSGHSYPVAGEAYATELVKKLFSEKG